MLSIFLSHEVIFSLKVGTLVPVACSYLEIIGCVSYFFSIPSDAPLKTSGVFNQPVVNTFWICPVAYK